MVIGGFRLSAAVALGVFAAGQSAGAADLPVACGPVACGAGGATTWVTSGNATSTLAGTRLEINQTSDKAVLNWAEFNIAAGNSVQFKQPSATSLALNKIFQDSPSKIFGMLTANGQVYLINQNGIVFGHGAQVNVGSLVASSLPLDPVAEAEGILSPNLLRTGKAAFAGDGRLYVLDADGNVLLGAGGQPVPVRVAVEQGASLKSAAKGGGRLMLLGQDVSNAGQLESNAGQVLLAAGQKIYVAASSDPELRGLLVEVDTGGAAWNELTQGDTVANEATGSISTPQGNISLVGLAVNQSGRLSATTSVRANGSVRLLARDTVKITSTATELDIAALRGGTVTMGAGSRIEVLPDAVDAGTAVDDQTQPLSDVEVSGRQITMRSGSSITATGGNVTLTAAPDPTVLRASGSPLPVDPDSQVRLESGSRIDVSGATAVVPVTRNLIDVELRANELRDSPDQRNGALRGKTVTVDLRNATPLADVSGAIATIQRGVGERLSKGGTIALESQGDVAMADSAAIDVSGGQVRYTPGVIATSQLVTADGHSVDIGNADPGRTYIGIVQPRITIKDPKWGVTSQFTLNGFGRQDPGYVDGQDAGTVLFAAPALAVNGNLRGEAVAGLYQRGVGTQPLGGRLIIGLADGQGSKVNDFKAPSVRFTNAVVPFDLAPGTPLTWDTLPLPTSFLSAGGFTRTEIYSNAVVSLDDPLELAPGSSLILQGDVVRDEASIRAKGGTVRLSAVDINTALVPASDGRTGVYVADDVHLDVRGDWVNDSPLSPVLDLTRPLYIDGGQLSLSITSANGGELALGRGVVLNADAGAQLTAAGEIVAGKGGQIGIEARGAGAALGIGESPSFSAFSLSQGGTLTVAANQLEIVSGPVFADGQLADPSGSAPAPFTLGARLFTSGGFGNFNLVATGTALAAGSPDVVQPLSVAAGSRVAPRMDSFVLTNGYQQVVSGAELDDIAAVLTLPAYRRIAANVAFSLAPHKSVTPGQAGALLLEAGSEVVTDPGGSIVFSSPTPIILDGRVSAPAGSISARALAPPAGLEIGFDPAAGIFVGAGAVLTAAGRTVLLPSDVGLQQGEVLDGGAITLIADRGSVNLAAGSRLDVSGTSATLEILNGASKDGLSPYQRRIVASAGGSIELLAPEGVTIDGELGGYAGDAAGGPQPRAGTLSLGLSRLRGFLPTPDVPNPFPSTPRQLLLGGAAPAGGDPTGSARIDPARLLASGFGSLTLQADDRIEFDGNAAFSLADSLSLQAPNITAAADVTGVTLSANYLALGPHLRNGPAGVATSPGGAQLVGAANLIDLFGALSLQGFEATSLRSDSDIRLTGLPAGNGQGPLVGGLSAAGTLALISSRLFPTTFTDYRVSVAPGSGGRLNIRPAPGGISSAVPLSAGGSLTAEADDIEQSGAVFAPLGGLRFDARNTLTLDSGSITSAAAGGQTILFGRVQGGSEWDYEAAPNVFTREAAPPEKRVSLAGDAVNIAPGAAVDVSGGGDLYAYEFVPGPGGSTDKLSPLESPDLFAVLPGRSELFAAYDTQEYANSILQPSDSVHLEGVPGLLAAGDYALLPARYALLPGAVLVQAVAGTRDLAFGTGARLPDGAPIVAGYREVAGTSFRDARTSGFAIRPGSYARQLAEYDDSFGTAFFTAQAAKQDLPTPLLAGDSGTLQLNVGGSLAIGGSLLAAPAVGGRGARLDLSANQLLITCDASAAAPGIVEVSAETLDGLGAESLLLGGSRSSSGNSTAITPAAATVTIANGARIAAPEVILTATDEIDLKSGAEIAATGSRTGPASESTLSIAGGTGSALVRVSRADQVSVTRSAASPASGDVLLESGARVSASGSITVSAAGTARSFGEFAIAGGSLSLGSSRIVLGAEQSTRNDALALSDAQIGALSGLAELKFVAPQGLEFGGAIDIGAGMPLKLLSLDAPTVNGSGADARLSAESILVSNTSGFSGATPVTGAGVLEFSASNFRFGSGSLGIGGFAGTRIVSGSVLTNGDFALTNTGDLIVSAPFIAGSSGSSLTVDAAGHAVQLVANAMAAATPGGVGAALDLTAGTITANTALLFPAGSLRLAAEQDLQLGTAAVLNVAGRSVGVGPVNVNVPGGSIALIARAGDVTAAPGARVDVSSGGRAADAGALGVYAGGSADLRGSMSGTADTAHRGGIFDLYAGGVPAFNTLADVLAAGGFTGRQAVEVGNGDLSVETGRTIRAGDIQLVASGGAVTVLGSLDARAAGGGTITLAARDGLIVGAGADLEAGNSANTDRGGRVDLESVQGIVSIDQAARIDVSGGTTRDAGTVTLRARTAGGGVAIGSIGGAVDCDGAVNCGGAINGAGSVVVAPVLASTIDTTFDAAAVDALKQQLDAYMQSASAQIRVDLGIADSAPVHIRPELSVAADGDLTLTDAIDFASWRYDTASDQPGTLVVRATGNLTLGANLSDGLQLSGGTLAPLVGPSWSYILVAGADTSSALPSATTGRLLDSRLAGDLTVSDGVAVRTGTGSITLSADNDISLVTPTSLVYTVGLAARPAAKAGIGPLAVTKNWLRDGGDISLLAGRDFTAAPSEQILSGWDVRTGQGGVQWAIDLSKFQQGVAALGGGEISVVAGRDVANLSATIPTTGVAQTGTPGAFDTWGGGNLGVSAGRDVLSGVFSTWQGDARIAAGRDIGLGNSMAGFDVHAIVASGDGQVSLTARRDLQLEGALNPTTVAPVGAPTDRPFFFTTSPEDALDITAVGGDLTLFNDKLAYGAVVGIQITPVFATYPGTLRALAPAGDISLRRNLTLLPAATGTLDLIAGGSVLATEVAITMSDDPLASVPSAANPSSQAALPATIIDAAAGAIHEGDTQPVRIVAGSGDVKGGIYQLAKHFEVSAARDVRELTLDGQNTDRALVSVVQAGRDLRFGSTTDQIRVGGPGRLQVLTGRNVDLGFGQGIVTTGATRNALLPSSTGADVDVWVGLGDAPDYPAFVAAYFERRPDYQQALVAYMKGLGAPADITPPQALTAFKALGLAGQLPLISNTFFNELRESGREANRDPTLGFTRGFAAIEELFPEDSQFRGDLSMVFSRIYTLAGGDINLLIPGGLLNVGLANQPQNLPVTRKPSDLGIVAEGPGAVRIFADSDVLVNQSRIFTLQGGDIIIWSSTGDIDAGRGAKSSVSAPPPVITVDNTGTIKVEFSDAIAGSGIRGILTREGIEPGDVDLDAPAGEVNAGDAGIGSAGNLNIAAPQVVGLDNIQVGGASTGVPTDNSGLASSLTGVSNVAAGAVNAAASSASGKGEEANSAADAAMGWLEVFVEGFGDKDEDQEKDRIKKKK